MLQYVCPLLIGIEGVHTTSCHGNTLVANGVHKLSYRHLPLRMVVIAMVKENNAVPLQYTVIIVSNSVKNASS